MITLTKTNTRGFRTITFRNQSVHQYFTHLQSVMRTIEPLGTYNNLFAKPEIDGFASSQTSIEWTTGLSGQVVHYSFLSEAEKEKTDRFIDEAFVLIEKYVAENKNKMGKERDYSQFLSIVGKRPNSNQIWVVGGKPTIVQWGFGDENGIMGNSGIYPNWDSFISDIKRIESEKAGTTEKERLKADETPKVVEPVVAVATAERVSQLFKEEEKIAENLNSEPKTLVKGETASKSQEAKAVKKETKAAEEKESAMLGLGGYKWVKWLAILLAIIIIILLLLRALFPERSVLGELSRMMGGASSGGIGGMNGMGGLGGTGGADGLGGSEGRQGSNSDSNTKKSAKDKIGTIENELCPVCGKKFGDHKEAEVKNCITSSQNDKLEIQKKLKEFEAAAQRYNEEVKEFNRSGSEEKTKKDQAGESGQNPKGIADEHEGKDKAQAQSDGIGER